MLALNAITVPMPARTTNGPIRNLWLFQLAADISAVAAAYYTTFIFRFRCDLGETVFGYINKLLGIGRSADLGTTLETFYLINAPRIICMIVVIACFLYALLNLYPERRFLRRQPVAWHIVMANVAALALFYFYFYLRRNTFHPRSMFITIMLLNTIFCMIFRAVSNALLKAIRARWNIDTFNVLLIGQGDIADVLNDYITSTAPHGLTIAARLEASSDTHDITKTLSDMKAAFTTHTIHMIILVDPSLSTSDIARILQMADHYDLPAKIVSPHLDVLVNQAHVSADTIGSTSLVHFSSPSSAARTVTLRRILWTSIAWLILLFLLPILGIISILIRITSPGPALFNQERIGVNRKPFTMLKFRTMHHRADEMQAQLEEFNDPGVVMFKMHKDPRITPLGAFLRRFSIDEFPQLLNVLKGEMTLVGPRPLPRRDFENYYEQWHYSRHNCMPGLTCLWQVSGRSNIDFKNMCILDMYYLRNQGLVLDFKILIKTFWAVIFAQGAY